MNVERHVSIFRNGSNQAIRIPREFELAGTEAIMRKEGERLIIEPLPPRNQLLKLLASWEPLDDDFPVIADPPRLRTIFSDDWALHARYQHPLRHNSESRWQGCKTHGGNGGRDCVYERHGGLRASLRCGKARLIGSDTKGSGFAGDYSRTAVGFRCRSVLRRNPHGSGKQGTLHWWE